MGKYLKLARRVDSNAPSSNSTRRVAEEDSGGRGQQAGDRGATKATKATKAPPPATAGDRDISDQRQLTRVLTLQEALSEINRLGSGPAKNAELYRRGELSEDKAVEYVTCAILSRRKVSFEQWRTHAPTVRAALAHPIGCDCEVCL